MSDTLKQLQEAEANRNDAYKLLQRLGTEATEARKRRDVAREDHVHAVIRYDALRLRAIREGLIECETATLTGA